MQDDLVDWKGVKVRQFCSANQVFRSMFLDLRAIKALNAWYGRRWKIRKKDSSSKSVRRDVPSRSTIRGRSVWEFRTRKSKRPVFSGTCQLTTSFFSIACTPRLYLHSPPSRNIQVSRRH